MAKKQATAIVESSRAGGYPYHLLPAAVKLGEAVRNHGARDVPRHVLAGELKMADAALNQLVASAKTYGMVEGSREVALTEAGRDYFFPTEDSIERRLMLEFFASPPVFKAAIDTYDGTRIPTTNVLANVFHRQHGVPQSWAGRAAQIFVSNATSLSIVDAAGVLRYKANLHSASRGQVPRQSGQASLFGVEQSHGPSQAGGAVEIPNHYVMKAEPAHFGPAPQAKSNTWSWSEAGGTVVLQTSEPLPRALWQRLMRYVEVMEPIDNKEVKNEKTSERDGDYLVAGTEPEAR
jgi:hypothetical protein